MVLLLITTIYLITGVVLVMFSPMKAKLKDDRLPDESWQEIYLMAHGEGAEQNKLIMKKRRATSIIFKCLAVLLWPAFLSVLLYSTIHERLRRP